MADTRRKGDKRPYTHDAALTVGPESPMRWLPRHGNPFCVIEWTTQHLLRLFASLPAYAALVTLLTLVVVMLTGGR